MASLLSWAHVAPANSFSSLPMKPISSFPPTVLSWSMQNRKLASTVFRRSHRQIFLVFANANARQRKGSSNDDNLMVDPVEAKRLAAKQMQEIQAKEKLKPYNKLAVKATALNNITSLPVVLAEQIRRRRVEAINGAWAMIGLTAGLVVEGQTGKGILGQLAGYWAAFASLFAR